MYSREMRFHGRLVWRDVVSNSNPAKQQQRFNQFAIPTRRQPPYIFSLQPVCFEPHLSEHTNSCCLPNFLELSAKRCENVCASFPFHICHAFGNSNGDAAPRNEATYVVEKLKIDDEQMMQLLVPSSLSHKNRLGNNYPSPYIFGWV